MFAVLRFIVTPIMLQLILQISICFILFFNSCWAYVVINSNGHDTLECCTNSSAICRTVNYAIGACASELSSPINILIQDQALISGRSFIDLPDNYVFDISPTNNTLNALLTCSSGNSSLELRPSAFSVGNSTVKFNNISFKKCGPDVPAAVLISGPLNVEFHSCTFTNNLCSGLNIKDTNLLIDKSVFMLNFANQTSSFAVDFSFGTTSLGGSVGIMFDAGIECNVTITGTKFLLSETYINTDSSVVSHDTSKVRVLSNYYASGGGVSVIHAFNSSRNKVNIKNCHFERNKGTYGGGLFLSFIHNTSENHLLLVNCTVTKNYVSQTGGGILFSSWDWAHNNTAIIKDCSLSYNDAMVGGAIKIIYNSKDPLNENKGGSISFEMHRTKIWENTAMSGSAIRLLQNLPTGRKPPLLPKLFNCSITGHKPSRNSKEYPGAVLSTRLGIEFYGENNLSSNIQGSAMYMSACTIHVKGKLILTKNEGQQGAAIYLADTTKLILYPGSHVFIANNHADFRGGGLYVEAVTLQETVYPYNPGCFLQYALSKTPPSKWKATMEFYNNSASLKGAAIFVKSLVDCLWNEKPPYANINQSLRWGSKIIYKDNFLLYEGQRRDVLEAEIDIATDTYSFTVSPGIKNLKVAPGEIFSLNITAIDQLGNKVYSVPSMKHIVKGTLNSTVKDAVFGQQYFVLSPDEKKPAVSLNIPSETVYHRIVRSPDKEILRLSATQSSFLVEQDLIVDTERCHPGFKFDGMTCICDTNLAGIERCSLGRYVYLKEGYWGGVIDGKFVTSVCPRGYCKCKKEQGKNGCFYDYKKPDDYCIEGREKTLCGRCKDGLDLGLRSTECRDCSGTGWFLAISMFGVLVFTLLIIYFNPNIPSDLRGILFYIQVLPFLFKPNDEVGDIVHLLSGITDLGRPTDYPFSTCAVPHLGNLGTTTLNYVTPAEVLIILFIIFLLRGRLRLQRDRPFQCFLVLMILMYKYLVETSFALLHCVDIGGKKVFFYDGSWKCYQGFHFAFFFVAVFVLLIFLIPPIPIIFLIVHNGANTYLGFRVHQPVIDAIAEGLRRHQPDGKCSKCGTRIFGNALRPNKNSSNGDEFKDCCPGPEKLEKACKECKGRSDRCWAYYIGRERGWWWAVDLTRRLVLVALYVFIQDWALKQTAITIACLFIFTLHCFAWPYSKKNRFANRIETVYLFALVLLANVQSVNNKNTRHLVSILILALTYGFALIFFIKKAVRFIRKWYWKRRHDIYVKRSADATGDQHHMSNMHVDD